MLIVTDLRFLDQNLKKIEFIFPVDSNFLKNKFSSTWKANLSICSFFSTCAKTLYSFLSIKHFTPETGQCLSYCLLRSFLLMELHHESYFLSVNIWHNISNIKKFIFNFRNLNTITFLTKAELHGALKSMSCILEFNKATDLSFSPTIFHKFLFLQIYYYFQCNDIYIHLSYQDHTNFFWTTS